MSQYSPKMGCVLADSAGFVIFCTSMPSIFLSHSSADKPFARRLADDLRVRGARVWLDEAEIGIGDSLIGRLEDAIDETDYLAVILSENSVESEWVSREVRMALHREISGKRVVVLPILYTRCNIPGFLRDKIYADFRSESNYALGIDQIMRRVASDRLANPASERSMAALDELPFTKAWRLALRTGTLSNRLLQFMTEILASMSPADGTWHPGIAISYTLFVIEVTEKAPLNVESWQFLAHFVEDRHINFGLRYSTMAHMCNAGVFLLSERLVSIPQVTDYSPDERSSILSQSIRSLLDPSSYDSIVTDIRTPFTMLGTFWRFGDQTLRKAIVNELHEFVKRNAPDHLDLIQPLEASLDEADISQLLPQLREAWARLTNLAGQEGDKNRTMLLLRRLAQGREPVSTDEIVGLFREASEQEGRNEYGVYILLTRFFSPEFFREMRRRRGDKVTFALLTGIIIDPKIEIVLSSMGLTALVSEFGTEGLLMDDRLLDSVFVPKQTGRSKRVCHVELFCEALASSGGDDLTDASVLITLASVLSDGSRNRLQRVINRYAKTSPQVKQLSRYLKGDITHKELEQFLKACGVRSEEAIE
jgi:TIR domain-containing protein